MRDLCSGTSEKLKQYFRLCGPLISTFIQPYDVFLLQIDEIHQ